MYNKSFLLKLINISIFILFTFFTFKIYPQRFDGGIILGITASQMDGDDLAGYDKLGLSGGAYTSTYFTNQIGAKLELRYTGKGAMKPSSKDIPSDYNLTLHYIDIPALLFYNINDMFFPEIGLAPGYLFGKTKKDYGGKVPKDLIEDYKKADFQLALGFGYAITPGLQFNIRYNYSLLSIYDEPIADSLYGWFGRAIKLTNGNYNNLLLFSFFYKIGK